LKKRITIMKTKLLTSAASLALIAVLGHSYAPPLLAQVRAALIKNIDEKGRTPYQADSSCIPTLPQIACAALFPVVPAGRRLVIEYVNAEFHLAEGFQPAASLSIVNTTAAYTLPSFFRFNNDYGVSSPVLVYVEAGQQAGFNPIGDVPQAHITGYLLDLTQ
jgi:hypothetical protein